MCSIAMIRKLVLLVLKLSLKLVFLLKGILSNLLQQDALRK